MSAIFTSITKEKLRFSSAGTDLNSDPIAIGKIGSTTVYKYTYVFPKDYTDSTVVSAYVDMDCSAFYDASDELIPYNLTSIVAYEGFKKQLTATVWLHIYGTPTKIMFGNASGAETTNISNLDIALHYTGLGIE